MAWQTAVKTGARFGFGSLTALFRTSFIILLVSFILINAILIGLNEGSIVPVIEDLGSRFLCSLIKIGEISREIISNEGVFPSVGSPLKNILIGIWKIVELVASFYILFLWLKLFIWIYARSPISNDSAKFINIFLAVTTIFIFQSFFILLFIEPSGEQTRFTQIIEPFTAIKDFVKALPYFLPQINKASEFFINGLGDKVSVDNSTITPIINNTSVDTQNITAEFTNNINEEEIIVV